MIRRILFDSATPVTVALPGDATASFVSAGNENSAAVLSGVATFPPVVTSVVPNTAGPGDTVTVNGNYLNGGGVDFGGVVAQRRLHLRVLPGDRAARRWDRRRQREHNLRHHPDRRG